MAVTCVTYAADGWGTGAVWTDETGRVLFHELPRPSPHPGWGPHPPPSLPRTLAPKRARVSVEIAPEVRRFVHSVEAYFRGDDVSFDDVELDLDWCTPFQRAAAHALRRVPRGEVVTYAELAALAGHPNAQRAAGTFCAHNRFPLVVPCHRVVSAAGLGSFGELGTDYKRRLLRVEGVGL